MPFRLVLILLTITAATADGALETPLTWWTTNTLAKVKPLDSVPSLPVKIVDLYAGRNECEPFQIVLRATSRRMAMSARMRPIGWCSMIWRPPWRRSFAWSIAAS